MLGAPRSVSIRNVVIYRHGCSVSPATGCMTASPAGRGPRVPTRRVQEPPPAPDELSALVERLLVADALGALAARPRQVLELAFYSGFSQSEIAERLALPLGTVKSDMRRALVRLRHILEAEADRG